jgi:hypothetical protein
VRELEVEVRVHEGGEDDPVAPLAGAVARLDLGARADRDHDVAVERDRAVADRAGEGGARAGVGAAGEHPRGADDAHAHAAAPPIRS